MPVSDLPKVAIVGRPNVGKSSLFNRIVGARRSIVEPASGTTRDRLYAEIRWRRKRFTLIDTGGFEAPARDGITPFILKQLDRAIEEADVIFFVTDGAAGLSHQDTELASRLRKTSKKIYLIVNKIDDSSQSSRTLAFFELGLGSPYAVSAINGSGIETLLDGLLEKVDQSSAPASPEPIKVAIVGRPNVGKSSYLNAILNEERSIVHHIAGTTRDAIDTDFGYKGIVYRLIDTAGMRHNMKLKTSADFYGSVRSKEAVARADVAIVIIDGMEGMREDDERILDFCVKKDRAVILAVNKWDLVRNIERSKYTEMLIGRMAVIRNFPVFFISCKTRSNILPSFDLIRPLYERAKKIFDPKELDGIVSALNASPEIRNKRMRFEYLKQAGTGPSHFILGMKNPRLANENLKRYIENFLRRTCDLAGVPVKITFEKRGLLRSSIVK
ncbi:MAG: ribosome biogenesis GTPase Der [Candidatus Omnitrophota bacterium]